MCVILIVGLVCSTGRSVGSADDGSGALHGGMIKKTDVTDVRVRMRLGKSKFGTAPVSCGDDK